MAATIAPSPVWFPRHVGPVLLVGLVVFFAGAKSVLFDTLDPDLFWHLRVADRLVRDGVHPIVDDLSFASIRRPWTPYSWLAELGMRAVWNAGGYRLAAGVAAGVIAMLFTMVAMSSRAMRVPAESGEAEPPSFIAVALATLFAVVLAVPYLSFRPVTAAVALLAVCTWLLLRDRRMGERSAAVWWVAPITALLINVHLFAFLVPVWVGILLIGAGWEWFGKRRFAGSVLADAAPPMFATVVARATGTERVRSALADAVAPAMATASAKADPTRPMRSDIASDASLRPSPPGTGATGPEADPLRSMRRYGILLNLTLAACLMTPMLAGAVRTTVHYQVRDPMIGAPVIAETQPFWHGGPGKLSAALVALLAVCVLKHHRRLRIGEKLWLALGVLLLFEMGRLAPLFVLIGAPVLAATLPRFSDRILYRPVVVGVLVLVMALCFVRLYKDFPTRATPLDTWVNRNGPDAPGYPTGAAAYVAQHIPPVTGHLINEFSWGGYLAWRLGPRFQVLVDGRTQLYPPEVWQATYLGTDAQRRTYLASIHADAAVLPVKGSQFRAVLNDLGWVSVYRDERAEVMTRRW